MRVPTLLRWTLAPYQGARCRSLVGVTVKQAAFGVPFILG